MAPVDLALRTIHLKLYPPPKLFTHRREVLRIISTYGEVTVFRSLKYHPVNPVSNSFLAIFASITAAQELLNASPLKYHVIPHSQTQELSASASDSSKKQEFSLNISSTSFSHEQFIRSRFTNPLHGAFFPMVPKMSLIGSSLSQHFNCNTISAAGLLDWDTDRGRGQMRVRNTMLRETPGKIFSRAVLEKCQKGVEVTKE